MSVGWRKLGFGDAPVAPPLMGRRIYLRPPRLGDWREWADLRLFSRDFLTSWEPAWPSEALTKATFRPHARQGYMSEALEAVREHAFSTLELSRLEAACLPGNIASRRLLERCGFRYEGVAQAYLQIDGRWRNHVLYAALRSDRRGRVED